MKRGPKPSLICRVCGSNKDVRANGVTVCRPCKARRDKISYLKNPPTEKRYLYRRQPCARFVKARAEAKRHGHDWTLSWEQYEELIRRCCEYCGLSLPEVSTGLDRKDSSRGYTPDNVVPCCRECNVAKNAWFTYEEFLTIGPAIRAVKLARV
jgi:5-methylcytosine-specific restriction endonuclease McrA